MTTATLTLTDFLLARIAEDEAVAKKAAWTSRGGEADTPWGASPSIEMEEERGLLNFRSLHFASGITIAEPVMVRTADHIVRHDPARVLAECEAKRRIVDQLAMTQPPASGADYAVEQELEVTLMHLAAVHADHPDYRSEWAV